MISTRKRVPALFRWSARDGLGANGKLVARSYSSELDGVFTRAGVKRLLDRNGRVITIPHSAPPLGYVHNASGLLVSALLLEPAGTNLCPYSQKLDESGTWTNFGFGLSVDVTALSAPDGAMTGNLITDDGSVSAAGKAVSAPLESFTGDGTKCVSLCVRQGSASQCAISLADTSSGTVHRHRVVVTWTAGVPSLATESGAGTLYPVVALRDGWYLIRFSVNSVVAANSHQIAFYPFGISSTPSYPATVGLWGFQVEDGPVPSSYIPTTSGSASRSADSLYFDFKAVPQELTAYVRHVNIGTFVNTGALKRFLHIGAQNVITDARFSLAATTGGSPQSQYDDGTNNWNVSVSLAPAASLGSLVETRHLLGSNFSVQVGASTDGASEVLSSVSSAAVAASSWGSAVNRLYLAGLNADHAVSAITVAIVAAGTKTMDEMRALAEVA